MHSTELDEREHDLILENIEPLFNRVTIRVARPAEKVGGVYLPQARAEQPREGVVVRAGPDCKRIKPGDRVIYARYCGTDIELAPVRGNTPKVLICDEDEVLAIIARAEEPAANQAVTS